MRIALTGLGMVSSLGYDVVTSCAAMRAGLVRPQQFFDVMVDTGEFEQEPLKACLTSPLTNGFTGIGKWIRLAAACVRDLIHYSHVPDSSDRQFWQRTGIVVCCPYMNDDRYNWVDELDTKILEEFYVQPLIEHLELPVNLRFCITVCHSQAGGALALRKSQDLLEKKDVDRVIMLGADAYTDFETIEWLTENRRLKIGPMPSGIVPGEVAAAVMLEEEGRAKARGAQIEAYVSKFLTGQENYSFKKENACSGEALAKKIKELIHPQASKFIGSIYTDVNGEAWKSIWWGTVQANTQDVVDFSLSQVISPVESLGEMGAASMIASMCGAVRSFVRGYSVSDQCIILGMSDYGEFGLVGLRRP